MQWSAITTVSTVSPHWGLASGLRSLVEEDYGIIYITEAAAAEVSDELEMYREKTLPAIIQIPGVSGNTGAGVEGVKKTVEQAVGSDILFGGVS